MADWSQYEVTPPEENKWSRYQVDTAPTVGPMDVLSGMGKQLNDIMFTDKPDKHGEDVSKLQKKYMDQGAFAALNDLNTPSNIAGFGGLQLAGDMITGGIQGLGNVLVKSAGGVKGMLTPGETAENTANSWSNKYNQSRIVQLLSPHSDVGKAGMAAIGAGIQGVDEYYADPENMQKTLGIVPGMPENIQKDPNVGAILSAGIHSAADLSMLVPGISGPRAPKVRVADAIKSDKLKALEEIQKAATETPEVTPSGKWSKYEVDTTSPVTANMPPMERMASELASDTHAIQPGETSPVMDRVAQELTGESTAANDAANVRLRNATQPEMFEGQDHGYGPNPNDAGGPSHWVKDENGMPIRADLSLENQQLQNPLQRNLWGDELAQKHEQENPSSLTQAIDNIPDTPFKGDQRETAIGRLSGNNINEGYRGQRGAINPEVFKEGFEKVKRLTGDLRLVAKSDGDSLTVSVIKGDKRVQKEISGAVYEKTDRYNEPSKSDMSATMVGTKEGYRRRGLANEVYKFAAELGNDIIPSRVQTQQGKAMWKGFEQTGLAVKLPQGERLIPKSQAGFIDMGAIGNKVNDILKAAANFRYNQSSHAENFVTKLVPEAKESGAGRFATPESPTDTIQKVIVKGEGKDIPELGTIRRNVQSGPGLAGDKWNNPILQAGSQHLNGAYHKTDLQIRTMVKPLERYFASLSSEELGEVHEVLRHEMFNEKAASPEDLSKAGYSKAQVDAISMLREAHDAALEIQNKARAKLGKEPITKMEAYMASNFHGDYHLPVREFVRDEVGNKVLDKDGVPKTTLAWYIRTNTLNEGKKAVAYLRERFGDTLDINDKTKPEYRESGRNPNTPNDVVGAYHDMMDFFKDNPETTDKISQAMQEYIAGKGYTVAGQNKHFLEKSKVRGFEGDKPWLTPHENTIAGIQSQMNYLKSAMRWSNMQEAVANIKTIISDPNVIKNMPNAAEYMKSVLNHEVGATPAVTTAIESGIAKAVGVSRSSLYRTTADLKTMAYLQTLGLSPGYMVATPLQAIMSVPAWHAKLTGEGFKHNLLTSNLKALGDTMAGVTAHMMHEAGFSGKSIPMTELGKTALKYAEDAGIVSKNMFDESAGLGEHAVMQGVKNAAGWTVALPEKVARLGGFMSFVHHLSESGKYTNNLELFRHAEQLTDNAITSFKSFDRPQWVNNLGVAGQAMFMYKSFVFNGFNQMGTFANLARQGNIKPLAIMIATYGIMGGVANIPFMGEADTIWNKFKDLTAEYAPKFYANHLANGVGLKGTLISLLPQTSGLRDIVGYGAPSVALNTNLTTRLNLNVPTDGAVAPLQQELKEWGSVAHVAIDPSKRAMLQAAYVNMPPGIQGWMQQYFPEYHNASGLAVNPRNLGDVRDTINYRRTPEDETRKNIGVTSLTESRTLEAQRINKAEDARIKTAQEGLAAKITTGLADRDPQKVADNAIAYLKINPDSRSLDATINNGLWAMNATPHERQLMRMQAIQAINSELRLRSMQK